MLQTRTFEWTGQWTHRIPELSPLSERESAFSGGEGKSDLLVGLARDR